MGKCNNKTKQKQNWRGGMEKYKKLGSLLSAYEDLRTRTPVTNNTMESMNKIWPHQGLHLNQNSKIYKTNFISVLTYNYSTWGLTKA